MILAPAKLNCYSTGMKTARSQRLSWKHHDAIQVINRRADVETASSGDPMRELVPAYVNNRRQIIDDGGREF